MTGPRAYLIGVPGAGKTTLMRALTVDLSRVAESKPFAHLVYLDQVGEVVGVQLGGDHETFGGTDRLSMGVQPAAVDFVAAFSAAFPEVAIVGEGDRLATGSFLAQFGGTVGWVDTPAGMVEARRAARGSNQNRSWVQGRETKVSNLVATLDVVRLDGSLPLPELVECARSTVPAFAVLGRAVPNPTAT